MTSTILKPYSPPPLQYSNVADSMAPSAYADASKQTQIHFVRHGETAWSLSGQHTGLTDIDLTEHGEQQARALMPMLRQFTFSRVFTSPRLRARRTCKLAELGTLVEIDPNLAEWDYGEYEGRRTADILVQRPGWSIWRDGCPGGEMPDEVSARADRVIARLSALQSDIAVFSHGQFGAALAARWINLPIEAGQHLPLHPASLSILGHDTRHGARRVISLWNQTLTSCGNG